jgi:uncharacterized protein YndB with AHSA1/START domain
MVKHLREAHSVTIDRPVTAVFEFLADAENDPKWRAGVLDIRRMSGEGVGTVYRQGVKGPMGKRIPADVEITAFEPDRRIEFRGIAGPVRPHGVYELEPAGEETRLTFTLETDLQGLRGTMMARAVQRSMRSEVEAIENLKRVLESDA